jgi:hypothetical protein
MEGAILSFAYFLPMSFNLLKKKQTNIALLKRPALVLNFVNVLNYLKLHIKPFSLIKSFIKPN